MFFNANLDLAKSPIKKPVAGTPPTKAELDSLNDLLSMPLSVSLGTKDGKTFDASTEGFISVTSTQDGVLTLMEFNFSLEVWESIAFQWLAGVANAVKANPKSVSKQMRMFSTLISQKLPEKPTGDPKIDNPRQIVINKTIEQIAPGIRTEMERRINSWVVSIKS